MFCHGEDLLGFTSFCAKRAGGGGGNGFLNLGWSVTAIVLSLAPPAPGAFEMQDGRGQTFLLLGVLCHYEERNTTGN